MKNLNIDICCGARCTMMGSVDLLEKAESFKSVFPDDNIIVQVVPCTQECKGTQTSAAPIVTINNEKMLNATPQKVMEKMMEVLR